MKSVKIRAGVPVHPIDITKVRYDELDDAYVHTGTYPIKYPQGRGIFPPNADVWLIFIVVGAYDDEPQISVAPAGLETRFYTNAKYNNIPHRVFMAYSAGDLGTESIPKYLNNRTRVVYRYDRALLPDGFSPYQIILGNTPILTKEEVVFDLSKSAVLDLDQSLYYSG